MNLRSIVCALAAVCFAACQASPEAASAHAGMQPGECVGCLPVLEPPEHPATAYRFEVELWEIPLARAEELYLAADPGASSIALQIDTADVGAALRALHDEGSTRHRAPSVCGAAAGARALVPTTTSGSDREPRPWSAGLRLELGAAPTSGGWSLHELDFACTWISPQGERLASAAGRTPLAPDRGVVVWCLPSKALAELPEPRTAPAVVALVRVVPQH